jgi:hypothetical protein
VKGCPYPGCVSSLGHTAHRRKHAALPHRRCSCEWVGPYLLMHLARIRRRGADMTAHTDQGPALADPERTNPA